MEKQVIKLKPGEALELEVAGKAILVETEEKNTPTEHTKSALGAFFWRLEEILPELKGEQGLQGQKWDKGDKGDKWDKGDKGDKWDTGENGKDGKDGVDGKDGENGKSAYELAQEKGYTGTLEEWLAALKGEKGDKGEQGLPGRPGDQGPRGYGVAGPSGASAYQIAVQNGYVWTEQQWLQETENLIIAYSVSL